jgi:hypothetical protein
MVLCVGLGPRPEVFNVNGLDLKSHVSLSDFKGFLFSAVFSAALKQKEYQVILGYPFFAKGLELISYFFILV